MKRAKVHRPNDEVFDPKMFIRNIAGAVIQEKPFATMEYEDLCQEGWTAFVGAQKTYKPERGATFKTYAGIRIRGAMLDYLRRQDPVARGVRKQLQLVETRIESFRRNGLEIISPTDREAHRKNKALRQKLAGKVYVFEDIELYFDVLPANGVDVVEDVAMYKEHELIGHAIAHITDARVKMVTEEYLWNGRVLREIGEKLEVSESRVCQLFNAGLRFVSDCFLRPDLKCRYCTT